MSKDGIEIHFDEKRGCLELACEPDAFSSYLELARGHLKDLPEIPIDQVIEINIVDAATFAARWDASHRHLGGMVVGGIVVVVLVLAVIGAWAIIAKIAS